jgi:hypothetical protein
MQLLVWQSEKNEMKKKRAREGMEKGRCFFFSVCVYSEERRKEKEMSIFSFVWFVEKTEL